MKKTLILAVTLASALCGCSYLTDAKKDMVLLEDIIDDVATDLDLGPEQQVQGATGISAAVMDETPGATGAA